MAPMTRRRSARLASNSKAPSGKAATPGLDSLTEQNEAVEKQPASPVLGAPRTPASSSPAKPSMSEMHPSKANAAKEPPSSAVRLGFADIQSSARRESPTMTKSTKVDASAPSAPAAMLQSTPSKFVVASAANSPFTFRFARQNGNPSTTPKNGPGPSAGGKKAGNDLDLGLSEEARRMMEELREEALKIRADLEVQREQEKAAAEEDEEDGANTGRKIAKPKSRASRYSAAHTAQFSKMDSIANHPSAFRAGRYTPMKSAPTPAPASAISSHTRGLKRTQSKANLDDTPNNKAAKAAVPTSASASTSNKHMNPLVSNGGSSRPSNSISGNESKTPASVRRGNILFPAEEQRPMSAAKRIKQSIADDASSGRPVSRDGSFLPRPFVAATTASTTATSGKDALTNSVSSLARSPSVASLLTPTKSSLARSTSVKTPGTSSRPIKTPSKTPSRRLLSALKTSATTGSLLASTHATRVSATETSSKDPVSSNDAQTTKNANIFQAAGNAGAVRSALPVPMTTAVMAFSKTPAPPRVNKALPRFPATTPRHKLVKRVAFTPTTQRAVLSEQSPSLFRSTIPRSAETASMVEDANMAGDKDGVAKNSPSIRRRFAGTVFYPDLSDHELLRGRETNSKSGTASDAASAPAAILSPSAKLAPPPSVPGTFTFRSDKTISFGNTSPTGFGSSPGQASLRQVRPSTSSTALPKIPGSFPAKGHHEGDMFTALVATDGPNKENTQPVAINIIPHGIANKKRHRVSEAEEEAEREATERAAKKRKNEPVPEGEALLAPRLVGKNGTGSVSSTPLKKPGFAGATAASSSLAKTPGSAARKRPVLSLSRLNSLARPKLRK